MTQNAKEVVGNCARMDACQVPEVSLKEVA
jgi:hypothetical protein